MQILFSALIGYFLGSIQTAFLVGRYARHIDIREHGSNNAGASNVTSVMGWSYGALTAVCDVAKATLAVLLVGVLFPDDMTLLYIAGGMSVVGHIFPFYLRFAGGKGAACLIGMAAGIHVGWGALLVLTIVVLTVLTDYVAVGSLGMFVLFVVLTVLAGASVIPVLVSVCLLVLALAKHRINIERIVAGQEIGLRATIKKHRAQG